MSPLVALYGLLIIAFTVIVLSLLTDLPNVATYAGALLGTLGVILVILAEHERISRPHVIVAIVLTVLASGALVFRVLHGPLEQASRPPTFASTVTTTSNTVLLDVPGRLDADAMVELSDMPAGFEVVPAGDLVGASNIDSDSFCNQRPLATPIYQTRRFFRGGLLGEQRLYHIVAVLPNDEASRFLADVRTAATDCLRAGGEVVSIDAPFLGDESVRVITRPANLLNRTSTTYTFAEKMSSLRWRTLSQSQRIRSSPKNSPVCPTSGFVRYAARACSASTADHLINSTNSGSVSTVWRATPGVPLRRIGDGAELGERSVDGGLAVATIGGDRIRHGPGCGDDRSMAGTMRGLSAGMPASSSLSITNPSWVSDMAGVTELGGGWWVVARAPFADSGMNHRR